MRERVAKVGGQRRGADDGTVVELDFIRMAGSSNLTVLLHTSDCIDERGVSPDFGISVGISGSYDVGGRFLDHAEPVAFELTDDRCFPCSGRTGDDEPSHDDFF